MGRLQRAGRGATPCKARSWACQPGPAPAFRRPSNASAEALVLYSRLVRKTRIGSRPGADVAAANAARARRAVRWRRGPRPPPRRSTRPVESRRPLPGGAQGTPKLGARSVRPCRPRDQRPPAQGEQEHCRAGPGATALEQETRRVYRRQAVFAPQSLGEQVCNSVSCSSDSKRGPKGPPESWPPALSSRSHATKKLGPGIWANSG